MHHQTVFIDKPRPHQRLNESRAAKDSNIPARSCFSLAISSGHLPNHGVLFQSGLSSGEETTYLGALFSLSATPNSL